MVQIRKGNRGNLGMIFSTSPYELCCDTSPELSCSNGLRGDNKCFH